MVEQPEQPEQPVAMTCTTAANWPEPVPHPAGPAPSWPPKPRMGAGPASQPPAATPPRQLGLMGPNRGGPAEPHPCTNTCTGPFV